MLTLHGAPVGRVRAWESVGEALRAAVRACRPCLRRVPVDAAGRSVTPALRRPGRPGRRPSEVGDHAIQTTLGLRLAAGEMPDFAPVPGSDQARLREAVAIVRARRAREARTVEGGIERLASRFGAAVRGEAPVADPRRPVPAVLPGDPEVEHERRMLAGRDAEAVIL